MGNDEHTTVAKILDSYLRTHPANQQGTNVFTQKMARLPDRAIVYARNRQLVK